MRARDVVEDEDQEAGIVDKSNGEKWKDIVTHVKVIVAKSTMLTTHHPPRPASVERYSIKVYELM